MPLLNASAGRNIAPSMRYEVEAQVWVYPGAGGWRFVTLPKSLSKQIGSVAPRRRPAFGSVRVIATIGMTTWKTSLFPDAKTDAFLLPIKAGVRKRENVEDGGVVKVTVELDL